MKKTTIIVMFVTIIAKLFGFLRDTIVGKLFFGAESDAFLTAYSIPSTIFMVIAAALVTGFIPMYTRIRNENKEEAENFTSNIFNILVVCAFVVGVIMLVFPEALVKVLASGYSDKMVSITVPLVRIISVSVIGIAVVQLGTGYLNVNRSFVLPNLLPIPSNLIIVFAAVIANRMNNLSVLAFGALVGFVVQGLIMYVFMRKYGFRYKLKIDFTDKNLSMMLRLATPLLLSTLIATVNDTAMRSYATVIHGEGAYSYITMGSRLQSFATSLFVTGTLSVAYPTIAHAAAQNHTGRVIKSMNDAILLISLFILPAMVGFITMDYEIVNFVYAGQKIGPEQLEMLRAIFVGYSVGLFFVALRDLYTRLNYAYQDMKTPLYSTILFTVSNLILCYVLGTMLGMGLPGLTLASSVAAAISVVYLFIGIRKRFKKLYLRAITLDLIKILIACAIMAASIIFVKPYILERFSPKIGLIAVIIVAVIAYGIMVLALKVDVVLSLFKRKED